MSLFGAVADSYVSGSASFASVVAALSPTAWWRLGDTSGTTLADSSGNSHSLTFSAGVTLGATGLVTGDSDKAITSTVSDNAGCAYGSWLDAPTALSMFCIAKTSPATGFPQLAARDNNDNGKRIWQWRLNAGKMEFLKITGSVVTASAPSSTADGATHDYGVTYDGTNIRLYVDGVKVATVSAVGSLGSGDCDFQLAHRISSGVQDGWSGTLDEFVYKAGTVWADTDFANLHAAR